VPLRVADGLVGLNGCCFPRP